MTLNNRFLKRITALLFILLIFLPINAFLLELNNNANSGNLLNERDEDELNDILDPQLSDLYEAGYVLKINNTIIYPNGTFYLFYGDDLYFEVFNNSYFSSVTLDVPDLSTPIVDEGFTPHSSKYDLLESFSETGRFQATVTILNNSNTIEIDFYLDISLLGPRISRVFGSDTTYNPTLTEIYEGGIYSTYRGTIFELEVETLELEAGVSKVELVYDDGISENNVLEGAPQGAGNKVNFTFEQTEGNEIVINVNTTDGYENQWKPTKDLYNFELNASYGGDYYIFEFGLEVMNTPPSITEFEVDTFDAGTNTEVTVRANASDFEDDQLYYNDGERIALYTNGVRNYKNSTGTIIHTSNPTGNLNYLDSLDGNYFEVEFFSGGRTEFTMFATLNEHINISKINWIQSNLIFNCSSNAAHSGRLDVYDYEANSWTLVANLSSLNPNDWTLKQNQTTAFKDLIPEDNRTLKYRISYDHPTNIYLEIEQFTILTNLSRRDTYMNVLLTVKDPLKLSTQNAFSVELLNYWDNSNDEYLYKMNITNNNINFGSWTFQIEFWDHGGADYRDVFWYNFSEPLYTQIVGTAEAKASKIVDIGITPSHALNISSIPQINSTNSWNPEFEESLNISVDVSGINTEDDLNFHWYEFQRTPYNFLVQKNQTGIINETTGDYIKSNYGANLTVNVLQDDEGEHLNYTLTRDTSQSYAYEALQWRIKLENRPELDQFNISQVYMEVDNWFGDALFGDGVLIEFGN